jgi:hypothetical protein
MDTLMPTRSIISTDFTTYAHQSIGGVAIEYLARTFPAIVKDPDVRNALGTPNMVVINNDLNTIRNDIRRTDLAGLLILSSRLGPY